MQGPDDEYLLLHMPGIHLVTAASTAALAAARGPHTTRRQPGHSSAVHLLRVLLLLLYGMHHLDLRVRKSSVLLLLQSRLLLLLHRIVRRIVRRNLEEIPIIIRHGHTSIRDQF